jgi:hypothetical protein
MAALMLLTAVDEELVVSVKGLFAEATPGVALESTLVDSSRSVVTMVLMLAQLFGCKQVMFMCEDFFVLRAEVAHDFLVRSLDMIVQVSPAQASHVALWVGAVVSQEKQSVATDSIFGKPNTERRIRDCDVDVFELGKLLFGPREDDEVGLSLAN